MIRVGVLTVSDSAVNGTREDLSGPALLRRCEELGWPVVARAVVPDQIEDIAAALRSWADNSTSSLILTTGGTGIAPRDLTPEATRLVVERELPGLAELIRREGLQQTVFAVLSRGVIGTRKQSLIVNLPGSPAGAVFSLSLIEHLIPHVLELLIGDTSHTSTSTGRLTTIETQAQTEASQQ